MVRRQGIIVRYERETPQRNQYLFLRLRQRHAIDQKQGVDVGAARIFVGRADLKAVLGDEIVIVGDEQKEVARTGGVERGNERHAFPFLREIVAVVGLAVVQAELVQL